MVSWGDSTQGAMERHRVREQRNARMNVVRPGHHGYRDSKLPQFPRCSLSVSVIFSWYPEAKRYT